MAPRIVSLSRMICAGAQLMGATINCGIGWRTAISMWRWRISPACRPAWSWWISIRNVWCWSSRTRCDWISPAAGPPSAPVTCHPWSAARSCWAIRRTSTDASATCCSAEPDSLPWLRAGNLIRDSFGISACDYRWSAVDDFIDRARRSISTIDRHDSGRNRRITPDSR